MNESLKHKTSWRIDKFKDPNGEVAKALKAGASVDEVTRMFSDLFKGTEVEEDNILLNEGISEIWKLVIGSSTATFTNTTAQIGVGSSTVAENATQTDLQDTSAVYVGMDAGYPTVTNQTVEFRSTFDGNTANFAWEEFSVKHSTSAINLNRKVTSKGTKVSGETWTVSLKITLS